MEKGDEGKSLSFGDPSKKEEIAAKFEKKFYRFF